MYADSDFNLMELNKTLREIQLRVVPGNLKKYHLHSIENFIFHFHKLKERRSKAFVYA